MTISSSFNFPKLDFSTFYFPTLAIFDPLKDNGQPNENASTFIESSFSGAAINHRMPAIIKLLLFKELVLTPMREQPLNYSAGLLMGLGGFALVKFTGHPVAKATGVVLLVGATVLIGRAIKESNEW